jgi:DNA repair exonuclease SbcCD ATPase subunit
MDEQPIEEDITEEDIKEFAELQARLEEAHYGAIGKGITTWSRTEGTLVVIAAMLLDTRMEKAGLVLYSITNFYTWLSIIDELFAMDPRYRALRSQWTEIAERLKKLNDTRVRLAHHAVHSGKRIRDAIAAGEVEVDVLMPSLKPNKFDTRTKSKKHSPLQLEQVAEFVEQLTPVIEKLNKLAEQMLPLHLDQKKKIMEKFRELQQKVSDLEAKKES